MVHNIEAEMIVQQERRALVLNVLDLSFAPQTPILSPNPTKCDSLSIEAGPEYNESDPKL